MAMRSCNRFFAALLAALTLSGVIFFMSPALVAADVLAEAKSQAAQYSNLFTSAEGYSWDIVTTHYSKLSDGERKLIYRENDSKKCDYQRDSWLLLCDRDFDLSDSFQPSCHVINSKYCFELQKPGLKKPWELAKVTITDDPNLEMSTLGFGVNYRRPSHQSPTDKTAIRSIIAYRSIGMGTLADVPGLTMHTVENQGDLVVLSFAYPAPPHPSRKTQFKSEQAPIVETKLTVDSKHFYLPVAIEEKVIDGPDTQELKDSRSYEFDSSGRPLSDRSLFRRIITSDGRPTADLETEEVITYRFGPVAESAFTLSSFGFPEPAGVHWGWHIPTYGWIVIAAMICGGLWLLVRLKRRGMMA
ncbi:MAG: hypothetical protein ACJ8C4_13045 [Gemmataceae bacterium]